MEKLTSSDRTVFEKIFDEVKYLCKVATADSKEARQLEKVKKTFEDAYRKAQKSPTGDGGVRYALSQTEIQNIQSIGRKSINNFNSQDIAATEQFARRYWEEMGTKSPFFRSWLGDWRANDRTKVRVATQKGDTRGVQKNKDTGWDIQVSGMVFNETNRHTESYNTAAKPYLPYINSIVENAVLLDSFGLNPNKLKSHNSLLMHSLYAVADIGHGPEIIKLYVEEMNNPNAENTGKRAYQLQNVERYQLQNGSSQNNASSISSATGNIDTVADLFNEVKKKDTSFQPKTASKVVNADGTPKVVYHGSSEMFNTFSYGHIGGSTGVGILGDGFYFTDKKRVAKNYGDHLYPVYLQMRNPYIATESDAYKLKTKDLEAQGYDGVILHAPKGDVYMVFNNTQIKSATDNIGTFDGNNADIRYSASQEGATEHGSGWQIMGEDVARKDVPILDQLAEEMAAQRKRERKGSAELSTPLFLDNGMAWHYIENESDLLTDEIRILEVTFMAQTVEQLRKGIAESDAKRDAGLTTPEDIQRFDDLCYGDDPQWNTLDVYRPKGEEGLLPVIISIHGGGWVYGDKELYSHYCMRLAQRGFAVVNFSYRLAPENKYPAALEDICKVCHWVMAHGAEYQMDLGNIFMLGDSAGGQLCHQILTILTNPRYASMFDFEMPSGFRVNACALNCGCYFVPLSRLTPPQGMTKMYLPEDYMSVAKQMKVIDHTTKDFPPAMVMSARYDFLKFMAAPMYRKLKRRGVPCRLQIYGKRGEKHIGHVFHLDCRSDLAAKCNDDQCAFFREYLR